MTLLLKVVHPKYKATNLALSNPYLWMLERGKESEIPQGICTSQVAKMWKNFLWVLELSYGMDVSVLMVQNQGSYLLIIALNYLKNSFRNPRHEGFYTRSLIVKCITTKVHYQESLWASKFVIDISTTSTSPNDLKL